MLEPFNLAFISSILGNGTQVRIPLALENVFFAGGKRLLRAL